MKNFSQIGSQNGGEFSVELPDLDSFIAELGRLEEDSIEAIRVAMHEGAEIIVQEQKRLADKTGVDFLSGAITVGEIDVTKPHEHRQVWGGTTIVSGSLSITTGYHEDAFNYTDTSRKTQRSYKVSRQGIKHDGDYWKFADKERPGIIGMMYEFGRPGKSRMRSGSQMKQIRLRIPNKGEKRKYWLKAVPKEVEIEKGKISPRPHIRRGFDNKIREVTEKTIEALERETGKVFNE